jgi:hypothetical protein
MSRTLLIAEAIPLKERKMEAVVLGEFVRLFREDFRDDYYFDCKSDFLDYIDRYVVNPKYNKCHGRYKYIHLSGHGRYYKRTGAVFKFPKGELKFEDLPKDCFRGTLVTLSACDLGNRSAMEQLIERTKAKTVIAPSNSLRFEDGALWYVNFYYLLLKQRLPVHDAFSAVNSMVNTKADFRIYYKR